MRSQARAPVPTSYILMLTFFFSIRFFVDHLFHPSHYNPHTPSIFLCGFYLHPESKFPLLSSLYSLTTQRLPLFFPWLFLFWQYDFILTSWLKLSSHQSYYCQISVSSQSHSSDLYWYSSGTSFCLPSIVLPFYQWEFDALRQKNPRVLGFI